MERSMKIKVAVFFGGESVEHEVSIISAKQAIEALDSEKYEVLPIYISKQRDFYYGEELKDLKNYRNLSELLKKVTQVTFVKRNQKVWIEPVKKTIFSKPLNTVDVAIPVVHGTNGEDGTLQGYLEMLKLPYAGCDVIAAAVGQDKVMMRHILENSGLPLTPWFWVYSHEVEEKQEMIFEQANALGYPLILKPACLGSSVGVTLIHKEEDLIDGIKEAGKYDFKVVIEKVVAHLREINATVRGSCFQASVGELEEVGHQDDILSYRDKYQGGAKGDAKGSKGMASTARIVPAPIDEEKADVIKKLALQTFKVLGTSGICRIDFMMNDETKEIVVNEINTIPGSLAYYLWSPIGIDFTTLMEDLVKSALDRYRRKEKMTFSYDTNLLENYSETGTKGAKGSKG